MEASNSASIYLFCTTILPSTACERWADQMAAFAYCTRENDAATER